jgi:hypothetical protein
LVFLVFQISVLAAKEAPLLYTTADITKLYVDPVNGSDSNTGSEGKPFQTIERARDEIRRQRTSMSGNIFVFLRGGEYNYANRYTIRQAGQGGKSYAIRRSELTFDERDSGSDGFEITYKAYPGEHPVISGGKRITGWKLYDPERNIYKSNIGKEIDSRQLYVNGRRAIVARSEGIPVNLTLENDYGHTTTDMFMSGWKNKKDIEFVYFDQWVQFRIKVDTITPGNGIALIGLNKPAWQFAMNGRNIKIKNISNLYYIENAYELLDSEGEWYHDHQSGDLFYKPRSGEDMSTAEIVIPVIEELLTAKGSSPDNRFRNVRFEGLSFAYAGWLRPNIVKSHISNQNNTIRNENNRLPEGAITIETAQGITFERNYFSKLGITGLLMLGAIRDVTISGNKFVDISGGGMNIADGSLQPKDLENVIIKNNYIRNIGVEYLPSAGISVAQGKHIYIGHNEISDFPYTGIHMAWHSNGTITEHVTIENNYIHDYLTTELYDGGGIYTLGVNPLGNTENPVYTVQGNYIRNQLNHNAPLYPDNGSTWWLAKNNVVDIKDSPPFWAKNIKHQVLLTNQGENLKITNNYVTTDRYVDRGKNNIFQWNLYPDAVWPRQAINIISNAGLEEPYYDLWDIDERFNIIMNPGFETRQENVWHTENAKWGWITGEHYRNGASAKITAIETGGLIAQKINVQKGLHYSVSVWVKKESESNLPALLYLKSGKDEKSRLLKLDEGNVTKGKWTLLHGEFDFSGNEISDSVKVFVQVNSKAGESYYLDEFRVIEKNEADKKMLREAIKSARKIYDQAVEGEKPGEYPSGSKTEFLAGIRDAEMAISVITGKQQLYKSLKSIYSNQVWFKNRCKNEIDTVLNEKN